MKMSELASVIRSKNAGPFRTTMDLFFESDDNYRRVKNSGILTKDYIVKLYSIKPEALYGVFYVDNCKGIKITMLKREGEASGDPECRDILGMQQHVYLLDIEIP
jgi:hypothetical protein